MSVADRVQIALRHIRSRLVESLLVIVATAMGVALVASMVSFVHSYDAQTDYLLGHPAYRELVVEVVGSETQLDHPAVPFDPAVSGEIRLGIADVQLAMETVPAVAFGYLADATSLSTGLAGADLGRGGGGGFMGAVRTVNESAAEGRPTVEGAADTSGTGERAVTAGAGAGGAMGGATGTGTGLVRPEGEPPGGAVRFDLEQFFEADPDVVTELPISSFGGIRATADYFDAYGLRAGTGALFTDEDVESGNQALVLGRQLAGILFPDQDPLGTRVRLGFQTFTVIGVLEPTELSDIDTGTRFDRLAFVPNASAQMSFGGNIVRVQRPTRTLRFAVASSGDLEAAADQLALHFDTEYGAGAIRITAPVEALRAEREKLSRVLTVVLFLATAGLFIASINLFNLMLMRVVKQTKGIGIMRALGGSRREIFRIFATESALMSLAGAAMGLAASPFVYRLLSSALVAGQIGAGELSLTFLLLGTAGAFVFSLLFGVWPARQAARVDASLAIRTE